MSMGRTKVLCTASVEERVPPWMRGGGKGWVTAEYSLLPGSTGERVTREAAQGPAVRSHPGDPAADRALAPLGLRHGRARRAAGHRRLRRPPGRRWHADRVDLRGLRRAARRPHPSRPGRHAAVPPARRGGRRRLGRHRRWRLHARPALRGGQPGRGRHERGDDLFRPLHRGPGHGRRHALHQGRARRAAAPRRARHRTARSPSSPRRSGRPRRPGDPRELRLVLASANPDKSAEIRSILSEVPGARAAVPARVGARRRGDR